MLVSSSSQEVYLLDGVFIREEICKTIHTCISIDQSGVIYQTCEYPRFILILFDSMVKQ